MKLVRSVILPVVLFSSLTAYAAKTKEPVLYIDGVYGVSLAQPSELNEMRSTLLWNNTTKTEGTFNKPVYWGGSLGFRFAPYLLISVRYDESSQILPKTAVKGAPAGSSVQDSFHYKAAFLMLEAPIHLGNFLLTFGSGLGYATQFEFHQQEEQGHGERLVWTANPIAYRIRGSVGYNLTEFLGVFAEVNYEMIKSSLVAAQSYKTTLNSVPISQDRPLANLRDGTLVTADLSGIRYGAGLRLMF